MRKFLLRTSQSSLCQHIHPIRPQSSMCLHLRLAHTRAKPTSKPSATKPPPPPSLFDRIGRRRKTPFILLSIVTFSLSFYIASVYTSYRSYLSSLPSSCTPSSVPDDVTDRWDREAATFDRDVSSMESYTGMNWIRWWLIRRVRGHVLEASVGTGRNIAWYPVAQVESVTMVDQSLQMIRIAREKWRERHPRYLGKVVFRHQDVVDEVVCPDPEGFDFVVQTMGVCSTPRPAEMVRRLAGLAKPEGRVLLLEHGRSYYDWLNKVLDAGAGAHADRYGCWWNRDIGKVLEESGVEVVKVRRFHFGTTWWIEVKPGREMVERRRVEEEKQKAKEREEEERKKKSRWWNIWGASSKVK